MTPHPAHAAPEPVLPRLYAEPVMEQHYSPAELARRWGLHPQTVRGWFRDVPGVLKVGPQKRLVGKRCYTTLRIPESIAVRVHRERSR